MRKPPTPASPIASLSIALSEPGHKVLRLLFRGCAYRVHGAWRFRGSQTPANNATLVNLINKGLAERVEIAGHTQIRITPAGISARSCLKALKDRGPF
jgi:hypothetical protein